MSVVVFGFGDCTGGSQASFVTHPLVQTYYFSGANMPFAGRVVVPSFLPSQSIVSNYLSTNPGSMRGLVKPPFAETLDQELRAIDPRIPVPLMEKLGRIPGLVVGDNEPYSGRAPADYTVDHHAEGRGLPHIALEVRQDLISHSPGQERVARQLHSIIGSIPQKLGLKVQRASA